jgi:hypothetical protein
VALRAHLLHGARYRRLALVALAPWGRRSSDWWAIIRRCSVNSRPRCTAHWYAST